MNVLVLHGPNLNLLAERVGDDGSVTLAGIDALLHERAGELGVEVRSFQSNHEGALVDTLHAEREWADAIIVSPDALAQNGWVLRAAIAALGKPTVEVHLGARKTSVIKAACSAFIQKKQAEGYLLALEGLFTGKWEKKKKGKKAIKLPARGVKPALPKDKPLAAKVEARPAAAPPGPSKPAPVPARAAPARPPEPVKQVRFEPPPSPPPRAEKLLGRQPPAKAKPTRGDGTGVSGLSRALIRQKISDRLAGKLTPGALASWARTQWLEVQRGAPAEQGQREALEDALQSLTASGYPGSHLSDDELITLMTTLE